MKEIAKTIIKKDNKYLLLKRSPNSVHYPSLWDFVGGKLDPDETPEQAAVRETKEESNFDIELGIKEKTLKHKESKHDDDESAYLFYFFVVKSYTGNLKISPDHADHIWLSKEEISQYKLSPSVKLYFDL